MEETRNIQKAEPEKLCPGRDFKVARLPDSCISQIHAFEQELNSHGYWNIALVAYQRTC